MPGKSSKAESFCKLLEKEGVDRPFLARRLKQLINLGIEKHPKEVALGVKIGLAIHGEATDERNGAQQVFTGPVMMIVGATDKRMRALKGMAERGRRVKQLTQEVDTIVESSAHPAGSPAGEDREAGAAFGGLSGGEGPGNPEPVAVLEGAH